MRGINYLLLTISLLTINQLSFSQGCLPQGIMFDTQEEIDNFQENYPGCTEVEGWVQILGATGITNLDGLNVVTTIEGGLFIAEAYALSDLSGLNNLTFVNSISIEDCPVSDLLAFSNLTSDLNSLRVYDCDNLISLLGLEGIASINQSIHIQENQMLDNLDGLNSLTNVGTIYISNNLNLNSMNGIEGIEPNTIEGLSIIGNICLSECDVTSICEYLATPNGSIQIANNAPGCNSVEEVEEACFVDIGEKVNKVNRIQVFPNPAKDEITILCPENIQVEEVCIYSQEGRKLVCQKDGVKTIDVKQLEPGLYFVEIDTGLNEHREKLIIK
jgi:hypothetical protein